MCKAADEASDEPAVRSAVAAQVRRESDFQIIPCLKCFESGEMQIGWNIE